MSTPRGTMVINQTNTQIFSGRPAICLTRRTWHIELWPVDQSGYVHFAGQCCSVAHPWAAASLHIILAIFTAAGLNKFFPAVQGTFALAFFQATEKEARTALLLLRSEIPGGMCSKLRTAAASNNRDHMSQSLLLLLVRATDGSKFLLQK